MTAQSKLSRQHLTKVDDVKTRNAYVLLRAGSGGLDSRMSVCRAVMQRNCEQYSGQQQRQRQQWQLRPCMAVAAALCHSLSAAVMMTLLGVVMTTPLCASCSLQVLV